MKGNNKYQLTNIYLTKIKSMNEKVFLIIFFSCTVFMYPKLNAQVRITMINKNGVYEIPCTVNGLKLHFIFDTGSSSVALSLTVAEFMIKNGYLNKSDLKGSSYFQIANGTIIKNTTVTLKELDIGGIKLYNVEATIVHNIHAPLLLGQSAIKKLGKIEISGDELIILNKIVNKHQVHTTTVQDNSFQTNLREAKQGDAKAQYKLAVMYYNGKGFLKDLNKTFYWVKKSAEQGYAKAQYSLAAMYFNGQGTLKDLNKAFYWFKKDSEQGDAKAQYSLAAMYYHGQGTLKDINKAFYWYKKSAEQGNAVAQFGLAYMYQYGEGTLKDINKAFYWYKKSAEQRFAIAQFNLAILYYNGEGTTTNKKQAAYWMKKAYDNDVKKAKEEWNKLKLWKYEVKN